jgi:hypothetical protein
MGAPFWEGIGYWGSRNESPRPKGRGILASFTKFVQIIQKVQVDLYVFVYSSYSFIDS